MEQKNQQPDRSREAQQSQSKPAPSSGENRKDGPRYDDRQPRPQTGGKSTPERPTPGEAPRTTREPLDPANDPNRNPGPRYGDGEGDDPRRGTVEAGDSPEQSDTSGRCGSGRRDEAHLRTQRSGAGSRRFCGSSRAGAFVRARILAPNPWPFAPSARAQLVDNACVFALGGARERERWRCRHRNTACEARHGSVRELRTLRKSVSSDGGLEFIQRRTP